MIQKKLRVFLLIEIKLKLVLFQKGNDFVFFFKKKVYTLYCDLTESQGPRPPSTLNIVVQNKKAPNYALQKWKLTIHSCSVLFLWDHHKKNERLILLL